MREYSGTLDPEVAQTLPDQVRGWGMLHRGVVADTDDGDNPNFLGALEARQEPDVGAVRTDFQMSVGQAATMISLPIQHSIPAVP